MNLPEYCITIKMHFFLQSAEFHKMVDVLYRVEVNKN